MPTNVNHTPTIVRTEDYTLFKRINGNRGVKSPHVKRLMLSFGSDRECLRNSPILVNDQWEVIDGQHRLAAAIALKYPVYYIKGNGLDLAEVQRLNSMTKVWTPMDYALSYAELGSVPYKHYLDFKKQYGLNHDILLSYLGGKNPVSSEAFKDGKLKVADPAASHELAQRLLQVGQFYDGYNRRAFALAFKAVSSHPKYRHKRMLEKMDAYADKIMEDYSLQEDYERALERVYNKYAQEGERVRFI